jgi:hypothetical protein
MKKLVLIFAILFSSFYELIAQNLDTKFLIEEYVKQSEKQKKAAIIMIGAGAGTAALGLLLAYSANNLSDPALGVAGALLLVGSASAIIGIPILVSSASKARKAGQLSLVLNSARVMNPEGSPQMIYPALKISVPLNSSKR